MVLRGNYRLNPSEAADGLLRRNMSNCGSAVGLAVDQRRTQTANANIDHQSMSSDLTRASIFVFRFPIEW